MIKLRETLAKRLNRSQQVQVKYYSLEEMAKKLTGLSDEQYGMYAFYHEPLARKFTGQEKKHYIHKANACGIEQACLLKKEFPDLTPEGYVSSLGVTIEEKDIPTGGGHVIFAQYEEPDRITIFTDCLWQLDRFKEETGLKNLPSREEVRMLLVYHELFHAVEYRKKTEIYTQTEKIELWKKPFSNRSRILALSEIAAMAFAREMAGTGYPPYLLDVLLIYGYDREAACALYEEILLAASEGSGKE